MNKQLNFIKATILIILLALTSNLLYIKKSNQIELSQISAESKISVASELASNYLNENSSVDNVYLSSDELTDKIENKELKNKADTYEIDGCFWQINNKMVYYDNPCSELSKDSNDEIYPEIIVDLSISNTPVLIEGLTPVRMENEEYVKSDFIKWYNYEQNKFAYALTLKNNAVYLENEVINKADINNIFVWIPSFYYNEISGAFSYYPMGNNNKYKHFEHTTNECLPFSFYYRNRYTYGIWVQLDQNELDNSLKSDYNIDIHRATVDDIYAISLFQSLNGSGVFNGIDSSNYIITIGKGAFFNE